MVPMVRGGLVVAALLGAVLRPSGADEGSTRDVDFRADVYPILKSRCFACHTETNSKSGLRLDTRPDILGETNGRPLAVPGKSAESRLILAVTGKLGKDKLMPRKGPRLSDEEIRILRTWVDAGLRWDENLLPSARKSDHWAFQRVRKVGVPEAGGGWARNPIDAFVAAAHKERGLSPSPEASQRILIRRLSLDLTGLPPSPKEVRAFLDDASPSAYESLVERLLESPRYGERWGRHWLDVSRYADSEGYESNHPRLFMWRYRDYVVDSFNRDTPFDRFVREQVAGDEIDPYADRNLIATAFLAGARLSSNEEDKPLQRNDVLVDVVNTTAAAFLGLTLKCAQCHSHKFDPVAQRDYYRMQGFFVKGQPNNLVLKDPELWREFNAKKAPEYDALVTLKRVLFERGKTRFIESVKKDLPKETLEALEAPERERTPRQLDLARKADLMFQLTPGGYERHIPDEDKKLYAETKKKLEGLHKKMPPKPQVWGFYSPATSPTHVDVLPMKAFYPLPYKPAELRRAEPYLLIRGDVHQRGPKLTPAWPSVLGETPAGAVGDRPRTALAGWLTSRDNPLVARVWVNRVWHYHFGRGLVATPGDFGVKGARPSHPDLLDWLAWGFMQNGWSTKRLHRLIVTSATYRQSSRPDPECAKADPENRYLWRWAPRRLESEALRDSILAVTGELDRRLGGPFVPLDKAGESVRRSLYLMQRRDNYVDFQAIFDTPLANESCARRHVSTVALQPLFMLNNPLMLKRAEALARRVSAEAGADLGAFVETAFETVLGRPPDGAERRDATAWLGKGGDRLVLFCHVLLNVNEFVYIE